jgi:hypothetical protein
MTSAAKASFDLHISECREAILIYQHLDRSGYKAEFGLRFVWIAAVSALDHYITEIVIEIATERFANKNPQTAKLRNEKIPFDRAFNITNSNQIVAVLAFRTAISNAVRYKSFQGANAIGDGLSFIWDELHKWERLSTELGIPVEDAREKINNITNRRNLIAHNADFDEAMKKRIVVSEADALEVVSFVEKLVSSIEKLII